MFKNVVIAILTLIVVGLSMIVHRELRFQKTVIENLPQSVESQMKICTNLKSQVLWLRRHLEKTVGLLEAEYGLMPIPLQFPYAIEKRERLGSEYLMESPSLVLPYKKPDPQGLLTAPNELKAEIVFGRTVCHMNLNSRMVLIATADMEKLIDNFYQRLTLLESAINQDN